MTTRLRFFDQAQVQAFGYPAAVRAVADGLRRGLDPASDPLRTATTVGTDGTLLYMPSLAGGGLGVKLVTINPDNPAAGQPRIHATYVLFDPQSYAPVAVIDGTALTTLRTPAVSVVAVRPALRRFDRPLQLVIFGLGPQALGHLSAFCEVAAADGDFPVPGRATFVARRAVHDRLPDRAGVVVEGMLAGDASLSERLASADLVICASSAREPLFDSSILTDDAVVVAVGSSTPDACEVDTGWCARATVIVEEPQTALLECGEIVAAAAAGVLDADELLVLGDVATGAREVPPGPVLFKGSGMAWQDLLVAQALAG